MIKLESPWSKFLRDILGGVFAVGLVLAVAKVSYNRGTDDARSQCQTASISAELMASQQELANLKTQFIQQQSMEAEVASEKGVITASLAELRVKARELAVGKDCALPEEAVDLINTSRKIGG